MDVKPPQQDQTSNDDELAKVLASVNNDPKSQSNQPGIAGLQFEETPAPSPNPNSEPTSSSQSTPSAPQQPAPQLEQSPTPTTQEPTLTNPTTMPQHNNPTSTSPELENIKRDALEELRPLVDKLNLPPEEKFDTLLLIIRSTDDQSLVQAAHDAAKSITDDTRRAQALLDVIKEIDYFSNPSEQQQQ